MSGSNIPFELDSVKILSNTKGWFLDAWKYTPKRLGPHPVVVMAHGLSANKTMKLVQYAEAFATAGYSCVVFDYRRFGASDGSPRECVFVSEQLEDYRTVLAWVRQQKEFDPQRVVVWGTSFSGGHAISLASEKRLKLSCVISQCPYVGTAPKPPLRTLLQFISYGLLDLLRQAVGRSPLYIPACAKPGELGGMTTPESYEGINRLVDDKKNYPNRISASSLFELPFYNPASRASKISFPVLIVAAEKDELCRIGDTMKVGQNSKLVTITKTPGGHFDLYPDGSDYDVTLKAELDFLKKHVPLSVA
ncbi:hypothetical protein PNOK_0778600 [Pyrrhoderma noxium]|uniref:Serine aminopeptidase S33 domain-containing protein n=1 Tax=Pyrrhoderma noxium TaxID=2282107 RepID=A0A286U9C5_9AGAM|nr:hypothetical protein PNOK_0778600 [Pyrrhoderma noxium]